MPDGQIQWWGYRHTNGSLQPKRWFGDPLDLQEARESDFCEVVTGPFPADSREAAMGELEKRLGA